MVGVVEKPKRMSRRLTALSGRYVLSADITGVAGENPSEGAPGMKFQLTDAIDIARSKKKRFEAYRMKGKNHDCGNKLQDICRHSLNMASRHSRWVLNLKAARRRNGY